MQTKYAESEKFTVVLSYAQRREQQAGDFLTENAPNIPAFNQLNPTNAPCGGGIPDAYLFDHTGRLVSRGHPSRLYEHVPALVAKVPDPIPPGILGTFEPRHLVDEAAALEDPTKPVAPILERLAALVERGGEKAEEAKALLEQVRGWIPAEVERLGATAEKYPASCAVHARRFLARFEGVDAALEKRVEALHKTALKTPGVKDYVRALEDLDRAATSGSARKASQFERRAREKLQRIVEGSRAARAVKDEAAAKLRELDGQTSAGSGSGG